MADPDLQGRGQSNAEPTIAADPNQPDHLVASANDNVRGDQVCGSYWSSDGGRTWHDSALPSNFVRGTRFGADRQYFQVCGDTSVAWDSKGNAYELGLMFMRGPPTSNNPDFSSGIYVFRSTGNHGASWDFPGHPVIELADFTGTVVLDKPYMTVDNWPSSPFRDRVYATWSFFGSNGTVYIYGAYSSDYGQTFSKPVLVSTNSKLCGNTYGLPIPHGACAARRCATFSSRSRANRSTPIRITGPASCRPATTRRSGRLRSRCQAKRYPMKSHTFVRAAALAVATAAALALPAGPAAAAPRKPAPAAPARLDKKHLEIERHVWTAQFYLRKAGDVAGAAREYKAVLALDPQNVDASLALASLYAREGYRAAVGLMEQALGGVDDAAPEKPVIEDIVHRLTEASAVKQQFRVSMLATSIVNAFALPDGHVYVTRGMIDLMKKKQPSARSTPTTTRSATSSATSCST
ncbi:MAG TPA: M48 family metalloprotease [Kofleriaceae bacterium]